jgi:hypothetical protein
MSFAPRKNRERVPGVPMRRLVDPAGWDAAELAADEDWIYALTAVDIAELKDAVASVEARGLDIREVAKEDFALPSLGGTLAAIHDELIDGRGLAMIRGLPVGGMTRTQAALAYWGIGMHFGQAVSQNGQGHLLGHVKDLGGDYADATTRGYMTRAHMGFHSDRCDYVGLLCLHPAKAGGESRVVSGVTLYNTILERRPDLLAELVKDYCWSRHGEISPGESPWYAMPVFGFEQGYLCNRGISTHIYKSQGMPGVPPFTSKQIEAFEYLKKTVGELAFDMEFRQGDIQILNNHVTLHSRRGFEDWPDPARKRHLLRLWLRDGIRPVNAVYREIINGINVAGVALKTPLDVEEAA